MGTAVELLGREAGTQSERRKYVIYGDSSELDALSTLLGTAPGTSEGKKRGDVSVYDIGGGLYQGDVNYGEAGSGESEVGDASFSLEITGETVHITHTLETIHRYNSSSTTAKPPFNGAIGVSEDLSEIAGCDIYVPRVSYNEAHTKAQAEDSATLTLTAGELAYVNTIYNLVGKTNDDTFRGFAEGEVLFIGARLLKKRNGDWDTNFTMLMSPNQTGLVIGDITGIDKKGWEYLWVYYERLISVGVASIAPLSVMVERVYDSGDLSGLAIGS